MKQKVNKYNEKKTLIRQPNTATIRLTTKKERERRKLITSRVKKSGKKQVSEAES